jgi:thioredoxin-like negative regulator of GroEL
MEQMKQQMSLEKYGRVVQISKPDYQKEVTDASKDCWVIVSFISPRSTCFKTMFQTQN